MPPDKEITVRVYNPTMQHVFRTAIALVAIDCYTAVTHLDIKFSVTVNNNDNNMMLII